MLASVGGLEVAPELDELRDIVADRSGPAPRGADGEAEVERAPRAAELSLPAHDARLARRAARGGALTRARLATGAAHQLGGIDVDLEQRATVRRAGKQGRQQAPERGELPTLFSLPIARMLAKSRWVRVGVRLAEPSARLLPGLTAQVSIRRGAPGAPPPAPTPAPRPEIEVTAVEHGG